MSVLQRAIKPLSQVRTISSGASITAEDHGKTLLLNTAASFNLLLDPSASLGLGFWCKIKTIGVNRCIILPNGTDTIDGNPTCSFFQEEAGMLVCDGTSFQTLNRQGPGIAKSWVYVTQTTGTYAVADGLNISGIVKNGTGDITINFAIPFANDRFSAVQSLNQAHAATDGRVIQEVLGSRTTSSVRLNITGTGSAGTYVDDGFSWQALGRR